MTRDDFDEFKAQMRHFGSVHGKSITEDLARAYWQDLKAMGREDFDRACAKLRRTSQWFPKPADFWREGEVVWM